MKNQSLFRQLLPQGILPDKTATVTASLLPVLRLSLVLLAALTASRLHAVTHIVTDESDFNALPTLNAGDEVILQAGNYGALDKTLVSSISDDASAQSNPIRIYAEVAGSVNVTAPSRIYLDGRGIILAGLNFTSGSGMIDNASTSPASLIDLLPNSRYITLNNLKFDHCTTGDDYGHWIQIRGFNHTIEYCSFKGKDEPNANAIIAFKRNTSEAGITTPRNHVLRYCYFGPRECSKTANGYETIRIGDSSSQAYNMSVTVEHNVFYRAIWRTDGEKPNDPEIISNKSKGNIIRYNTFLESFGQITLRHGDACIVEGNFTFGGGYYANDTIEVGSSNPYQGGVRIIGQDHIVQNNYFENLQGTGLRGALVLMAGYSDFDDGDGITGDNTYEPAHNALIANNTFIDCEEFNLGEENGGTDQPTGVQIYNNAWQGNGSSDAIERDSGFTPSGSGGNYFYESNGNYGWTGLANSTYTATVSPNITESYGHYRIPTSSSPLVGAANATLTVEKDIRSLTRPLSGQDIGSFERGLSGAEYGPLLRNEVGPLFDGGPSGTYPTNAYGLDPNLPPSDNFDLSKWYLTLPVDENGTFTGEAESIETVDLNNDYTNAPWFVTGSDGAMVFTVPHNGAISGTSTSPRNELRETLTDGSLHNWLPADYGGSHTLDAVCTVNQLVDGVVIIGQIHGKEPNIPTVILRYDNRNGVDRIYLTVKETPTDPVTQDTLEFTPVSLGTPINYQLKMEGTANSLVISCTVNGETQSLDMYANSPDWLTATHYFKAGAYYTNPPANSSTEVAFYQLEVTHSAVAVEVGPITSTATASAVDGDHVAANTLDDNSSTRWSANSDGLPEGQWIQFDMGDYYAVHELQIAWYNGDGRSTNFDVEISDDGTNWRPLTTDQDSSGTSNDLESVTIPVSHGRYLRIVGHGNTINGWNSITEVAINGLIAPTITPEELRPPATTVSGNSVSLSFDSAYGRRYQLQHTPTLSPPDWQNIGSVVIGTGAPMMLTDPDTESAEESFYRIEVKP
ncbi:MAG: polysaccharide lyase family 7 protein [Opitutales bacterium]|nr:polysaccharide lyase family 7 protein [Opitutales bacterium]MDP5079846.1 polysaccharide lyase family 7 protein [Opitutales bacterium]